MNVDEALREQRKAQAAYDAAKDDLTAVETKRLAGFALAVVAVALVIATGLLVWIGVVGLDRAAAVLGVAAGVCAYLVLREVYGRTAPPALKSARVAVRTAKAVLDEANEAVARSEP